jgi:hypothetical protein
VGWSEEETSLKGCIDHELGCHVCNEQVNGKFLPKFLPSVRGAKPEWDV